MMKSICFTTIKLLQLWKTKERSKEDQKKVITKCKTTETKKTLKKYKN